VQQGIHPAIPDRFDFGNDRSKNNETQQQHAEQGHHAIEIG
jgi:hypothetical protein